MRKRGNGEGTVGQRSDGLFFAAHYDPTGKRRWFYAKTEAQVQQMLFDARNAFAEGQTLSYEKLTVDEYLQEWLEAKKLEVKSRTWTSYEAHVRKHIVPHVGRVKLKKLRAEHVEKLRNKLVDSGRLSNQTVRQIMTTIVVALGLAEKRGYITNNVAKHVSPPKVQRQEMKTLTEVEANRLLEHVGGSRMEALYVLALQTGMRQGELLGLQWGDIDFANKLLKVQRSLQKDLVMAEPKTGLGRSIHLSKDCIDSLRHRQVLESQERLKMGLVWEDNDLVFPNIMGKPHTATNLMRRSFQPLLQKAALPKIRFHDLRHTCATLLLGRGVHVKIVSEMLGHSDVGTTLNVYNHALPTIQEQAAEVMHSIFSQARMVAPQNKQQSLTHSWN